MIFTVWSPNLAVQFTSRTSKSRKGEAGSEVTSRGRKEPWSTCEIWTGQRHGPKKPREKVLSGSRGEIVVRGMHEVPTSSTSVARTSASESERDDAGCDCVVILDPSPSSLSRPWQAWNDRRARWRADTAQQRHQEEQLRADAAGDLLAIAPTVALA